MNDQRKTGMEKQEKQREHISVYEIADIMERVAASLLAGKKPHDYGTGKKYTPIEVHTASYVGDHSGCTITEIAQNWQKTKSAVSQVVKKLRQEEIIRTQTNPKDEKQTMLYLTAKGKLLDAKHRAFDEESWKKALTELAKSYSDEEINTAFLILRDWLQVKDVDYEDVLERLREK